MKQSQAVPATLNVDTETPPTIRRNTAGCQHGTGTRRAQMRQLQQTSRHVDFGDDLIPQYRICKDEE
ncbi:hypothetical protein CDV36_005786 [Fusarium kuroshium]|uniref:Uncharacterized protein n=1 Tax=Fusarium kuroshium TaxID=2010991 RepID=A0A3M2SAB1_9HYPO|nr:hypothetical protein CDV36_005786 [Fusarium kuroshium]RSL56922.1 hypothetical protein CEP53_006653 [Fusarium sp. AF-6]